jgi:hypothetical protein
MTDFLLPSVNLPPLALVEAALSYDLWHLLHFRPYTRSIGHCTHGDRPGLPWHLVRANCRKSFSSRHGVHQNNYRRCVYPESFDHRVLNSPSTHPAREMPLLERHGADECANELGADFTVVRMPRL